MFFRNFVNMWNLIGMWCTRGTFSGQEINKRMNRSASRCEFGSADFTDTMIRDKIVFGMRSERVKMKLLKQRDLDLNAAVEIC